MISYDDMPDENAELAHIAVSFPRLEPDSLQSCPVELNRILNYLSLEVPNGDCLQPDDLEFLRTADVEGTAYWIWRFLEPKGDQAYAVVSHRPDGVVTVGYDTNYYGLSPEQFILGDYHNVF